MLSLTWWQWGGIAIWVGCLVVAVVIVAVSLCRIAARAEADAEDLHRQAAAATRHERKHKPCAE